MPRRKINARSRPKKKKLRGRGYLIPIDSTSADDIRPGKLVAIAEYRIAEGY